MAKKSIDDLAEALIHVPWRKPSGFIPKYVYHYTDAAGLHGMLSSRHVWATDCRFLNDATESELGKQRAIETIRSMFLREKSEEKKRLYRNFLEKMRYERTDRNFIFSLSSRKDDLSQWRMYAREGHGFTVGFDTSELLELSKKTDAFGFSKVSYSRTAFDQRCKTVLEAMEKAVSDGYTGKTSAELENEAAINLEWVIASYSVLFKHSSFMSEREWRINTFAETVDDLTVKVRPCGNRLVPYVEIRLCADEENCLPVRQVGIGPGFKQSSTRFAVERLLEMTETDAQIYDADTPFRRL